MTSVDLVSVARIAAESRARPLESNFAVGSAILFSNEQIVSGANYENRHNTIVGACAERSVLKGANNAFGPLGSFGQGDAVSWKELGVWAGSSLPPAPCGLCRDELSASASPEALVRSRGLGHEVLNTTIGELLPLAGRGKGGDVRMELEWMTQRGTQVSDRPGVSELALLDEAKGAAARSYLPPFTKEPPSGAAIELNDGTIVTGWFITEATTRLGGSAIVMAARRTLEKSFLTSGLKAVRAALFTDSETLRAPTGCDLQFLQEMSEPELTVTFSCHGQRAHVIALRDLLPLPFGRRDLGY